METNRIMKVIQEDLTKAVKNREKERTTTLRMLIGALKNAQIDNRGELDEEMEISVLSSYLRKCRESIAEYEKGGRDDLVAKEKAELEIVTSYLPEQLGEDQIRIEVRKIMEETGAQGPRDMGKVMGPVMKKFKGQADGSVVKRIVGEMLERG